MHLLDFAPGRGSSISGGQGASIARGEVHAKGSDTGMTAIMVQVADLVAAPDAAPS